MIIANRTINELREIAGTIKRSIYLIKLDLHSLIQNAQNLFE